MLNAALLQSTMAKLSLTAARMDQEKGEKLRKHELFFPFTGKQVGLTVLLISVESSLVGYFFYEIPLNSVSLLTD